MSDYPKLIQMGEASMLAFLDKQGDPRMIHTADFRGAAPHRTHANQCVVRVKIDEDDVGEVVIAIPSVHAVADFISLGLETKK